MEKLLCAVGDPLTDVEGIGAGHREFVRAQIIRASTGVLAKTASALPRIDEAVRAAEGVAISLRARAHLAAAKAWLQGDPVRAAQVYDAMLTRWPHDLIALRLAQSCYFFLGEHAQLCAVIDKVWPAWDRRRRGYPFVLAMASFAYAENGHAAYAERLGRESLAIDPACPMGVHAVAHAIAESGRHAQGAQWMREQVAQWGGESRMRTHNAWHLAMFDADSGNIASATSVLDTWLMPACKTSPLDACDAVALMWRLAAEGVEDGGRWAVLSDAFEHSWTPGFWPYVDLHAGLAHWRARQWARATGHSRAIDAVALGSDYAARRARRITQPALQALHAWAHGKREQAARLFAELEPVIGEAGGSRIQLELFEGLVHPHPRTPILAGPGSGDRKAA